MPVIFMFFLNIKIGEIYEPGSWGSMVTRLKLERIDGKAPPGMGCAV